MFRRTYHFDQNGDQPSGAAPAQGTPPAQQQAVDPQEYERLKQQYAASSSEARRLKQERDGFEQQLQRYSQPQQQDPFQRLNDMGVPVDALDAVIEQRIQQRFQPIARGIQARSQVLSEYPDYGKYESDVSNFINGDPTRQQTYNSLFSADPVGAMEWAFQKFGATQKQGAPAPATTNKSDRADAQIPSGRSGESRNRGDEGDGARQAWEHFRKTGDPTPFAKARLRGVISDDFFERNR